MGEPNGESPVNLLARVRTRNVTGIDAEADLCFEVLGVPVEIASASREAMELFRINFAGLQDCEGPPLLSYRIERRDGFLLQRTGSDFTVPASDLGALVYALEADLVIQMQLSRPDLLFLHAAVVEVDGGAYCFVGRSGVGKSTTCWGLLHNGFRYLSDELAPVDVTAGRVGAYPHALCLKATPPGPYPLPPEPYRTTRGVHLLPPTPARCPVGEVPVRGLFLMEREEGTPTPALEPMSRAEAAARIYPHALNALAHEGQGLAPVLALAAAVPTLRLLCGPLTDTCKLLREHVRGAQ